MTSATSALPTLCIVVPCHDEEESLPALMGRMEALSERLSRRLSEPVTYVFVDDGSRDHTLSLLESMHERDERVHFVAFSRNFGKEAALAAGLERAYDLGCDLIAVMDADLQDPPELLVDMLEKLASGDNDIAAAYRVSRAGEPRTRSFFAHRFYRLMSRISDVDIKDGARDFRVMRRDVVRAILEMPERTRFSKGMFAWVGFDTAWIPYENVEREHGSTSWSFWDLVDYAFQGIISYSVRPLEVISAVGLLIFLLSIIAIIFVVVRKAIYGDPVSGWPSLVCIILFCAGIQILAVGVVGLYVSRIYTEAKQRPLYVVKREA